MKFLTRSVSILLLCILGAAPVASQDAGDPNAAPPPSGQEETTTTLTTSANPAGFGTSVTFTATVSALTIPTGTVSFTDGPGVIAQIALADGVATFTTSDLAEGSHSIQAWYSSDATHTGSLSSVLDQTVSPSTPPPTSSGPAPAPGTAPATAPAPTDPAGGTEPQPSPTGPPAGSDSGPGLMETAIILTTSGAQTGPRGTVTLTAIVSVGLNVSDPLLRSAGAGPAGAPTGHVTFLDGTTVLGRAVLDDQGIAMLTTPLFGEGVHLLTARYNGDALHAPSLSAAAVRECPPYDPEFCGPGTGGANIPPPIATWIPWVAGTIIVLLLVGVVVLMLVRRVKSGGGNAKGLAGEGKGSVGDAGDSPETPPKEGGWPGGQTKAGTVPANDDIATPGRMRDRTEKALSRGSAGKVHGLEGRGSSGDAGDPGISDQGAAGNLSSYGTAPDPNVEGPVEGGFAQGNPMVHIRSKTGPAEPVGGQDRDAPTLRTGGASVATGQANGGAGGAASQAAPEPEDLVDPPGASVNTSRSNIKRPGVAAPEPEDVTGMTRVSETNTGILGNATSSSASAPPPNEDGSTGPPSRRGGFIIPLIALNAKPGPSEPTGDQEPRVTLTQAYDLQSIVHAPPGENESPKPMDRQMGEPIPGVDVKLPWPSSINNSAPGVDIVVKPGGSRSRMSANEASASGALRTSAIAGNGDSGDLVKPAHAASTIPIQVTPVNDPPSNIKRPGVAAPGLEDLTGPPGIVGPISGIPVGLEGDPGSIAFPSTQTGQDGEFRFDRLPPGNYILSAQGHKMRHQVGQDGTLKGRLTRTPDGLTQLESTGSETRTINYTGLE